MSFEPYRHGKFLKPLPDTIWPAPDALDDVEHTMRYGTPESRAALVEEERLMIASVISAYRGLVLVPDYARQLPGLRMAMRRGDLPSGGDGS